MSDNKIKYGFKIINDEFKGNHHYTTIQDIISGISTTYHLMLEKQLYKRLSTYQLITIIKDANKELQSRKNKG